MSTFISRGLSELDLPSAAIAADAVTHWDLPRAVVLVACNADAGSRAAARVALEVAPPDSVIRALAVNDAGVIGHAIPPLGAAAHTVSDLAGEQLRTAVKQQLDGCACDAWPLDVRAGDPAMVICHTADDLAASLIVIGLNEHDFVDRALRRETSLRVTRHAKVPVLTVVPWAIGRPRVIIAAVDFSAASVRAARVAASLAATDCAFTLVHVLSPAESTPAARSFAATIARSVEDGLVRLARDIALPNGGTVEWTVLRGNAADEIAALAAKEGADLIALGASPGGIGNVLHSSVRASLMRQATRSLLVVPALNGQVVS